MALIKYEELVQNYNDSLANVLRGFRPKYDFLELWVPDADPKRSIVNLVESAQSFGVPTVDIQLSKQTMDSINMNDLISELNTMGSTKVVEEPNQRSLNVANLVEGESSVATDSTSGEDVPALYKGKITEALKDIRFEGSVQEDDEMLLIRSCVQGINFFAGMDTKHHIIKEVAFSGPSNDRDRALLEQLCRIVKDSPIQDASDHAMIKLEWSLRDHSQKSPVEGIASVFNFHEMFKLPQTLIRELYETYKEKTDYNSTVNFWDGKVSPTWREASIDERVKRTQVAVDHVASELNIATGLIQVVGCEKTVKMSIAFTEETDSRKKAKVMLSLEKRLRNNLEPKIELYQERWMDKNKNRRIEEY